MSLKRRLADHAALLLLLFIFAAAYGSNLDGWLKNDDEGTDFYEVWQLQIGHEPGVDFIAEQQPLFLLGGRALLAIQPLVGLHGRTAVLLRLWSAAQILLGAFALALAARRIWGDTTASLTLGFILTAGLVVDQGRQFRPDPMMLAWEMVALAAVLLAVHTCSRRWWAAAGAAYGIAFLFKPFALFPVAALAAFFAHRLWQSFRDSSPPTLIPHLSFPRRRESTPTPTRAILQDGLAFALPFLLVAGGVSLLLYSQMGYYYGEAFAQHASLGAGRSLLSRTAVTLGLYGAFFLVNGVFLLFLALAWVNRRLPWRDRPTQLLLWQLAGPLVMIAITRPLYVRYYLFLVPVLAILLANQIRLMLANIAAERPSAARFALPIAALFILFAAFTSRPRLDQTILRTEIDTRALAAYVSAHTQADELVLTDYAGLNFFADRASIYEASIIAAGRIQGGIITGEMLIDRIESEPVAMVLVHVPGGLEPPGHFIHLHDYERFRAYLQTHFTFMGEFDRAGQRIELYHRPERSS